MIVDSRRCKRTVSKSWANHVCLLLVIAMTSHFRTATAAEVGTKDEKKCQLIPIHTGICQIGKDHVLGGSYTAEDRMPFLIYSFLVKAPDSQTVLIDLGPKTVDYCNRMFRRHGFFRDLGPRYAARQRFPDDIVQPFGNVLQQLPSLDVLPADIKHIVFTHLHADHHGMDDATDGGVSESFPGAMLHVSSIGWQDNLTKRRGNAWSSYVDYAFSDFLLRRQEAGKVRFEDNAQIIPGVRTVYLGGHSVCSQAVVVETSQGTAIIASDEVYLYQLLEDRTLPQIRTSATKYRTAIDRLVEIAQREHAILVPLHDPIVWKTYRQSPDNWLKQLKTVSDNAIKQYIRQ